jgi:hypothetical protein
LSVSATSPARRLPLVASGRKNPFIYRKGIPKRRPSALINSDSIFWEVPNVTTSSAPEPSTIVLAGLALVAAKCFATQENLELT